MMYITFCRGKDNVLFAKNAIRRRDIMFCRGGDNVLFPTKTFRSSKMLSAEGGIVDKVFLGVVEGEVEGGLA